MEWFNNGDHKVLTRRGYIINKDKIKKSLLDKTLQTLTVTPLTIDYGEKPEPFPLYREHKNLICVPRFFGTKTFGQPERIIDIEGADVKFTFKGEPRDIQIPIIEHSVEVLNDTGGGVLQLYCGIGKTVIALKIGSILKKKMLIIVHKTSLQNQWYDRIKTFTDAKVGLIRQKKTDVEGKDIVVAMLQSLAMIDYDMNIFDDFGFVVCDECFSYKQRIITRGVHSLKIGDIYKRVYEGDRGIFVLSFNEDKKTFEYKRVIAASKHIKHVVKGTIGKSSVICTPDHKFLTLDGYCSLSDIKYNQPIIASEIGTDSIKILTDDGFQVLIGLSLLGFTIDTKPMYGKTAVRIKREFYNDSGCITKFLRLCRVMFLDCDDDTEIYKNWITSMFGGLHRINRLETDWILSRWDVIYTREELIDMLDERGVGVLMHSRYVDLNYGALRQHNEGYAYMFTFTNSEIHKLNNKFHDLGIDSKINYDAQDCIRIEFVEQGYIDFTNKITPYFPDINAHLFKDTKSGLGRYHWSVVEDVAVCFLTNITNLSKKIDVYDIEVEDNHNFVLHNGCVVHNCHHFASRVFSRALFKVGSKMMLGLSATPKRNDGLTKILHWYLGDIIYKLERAGDSQVYAKCINSYYDDPKYVEKKIWVKNIGAKPNVPIMVNRLVDINNRNKFIIDTLWVVMSQDERKILVLSDRIEHLENLKKGIDTIILKKIKDNNLEEGEITTALYIGRMKSYELEDSQKADIIFATYGMASEGLDIPDLNCLLLSTPKSDVVQCVGRILRKQLKNGDLSPMIIDICDQFSVFERQAIKRADYYKKKQYTVETYNCLNGNIVTKIDYIKKMCDPSFIEMYLEELDGKDDPDDYEPDLKKILAIKQKL